MKQRIFFLVVIVAVALFAAPQAAHADEPSPWGEILNPDGTIQWNNLTDLGTASQPADWMAVTLPGGIVLHPDANFHRYQTPSGNILVLPSPATLFFMAMHPDESNLNGAQSILGNGAAMLMLLAGPSLDQQQLATILQMGYTNPEAFFQAVIDGEANIWSVINVNFIYELLNLSYESGFLVNAFLLYLNGIANCADIPGGCEGIPQCPDGDCLPLPSICPAATIAQNPPAISIQKIAPDYPLVIGPDPEKRGADIQAVVSIPPVIFTWYEEVQDPPTCERSGAGNGGGCPGPASRYDNPWTPVMENNPAYEVVDGEIHCIAHVEILPEPIVEIQATAELNSDSRSWILNDLAGKYYQAYLHNPYFRLAPGLAQISAGCDGSQVCSVTALAANVPFADPGTFDLRMWAYTAGTIFTWNGASIPITQPRVLFGQDAAQIYVTLVTLLPAGAP
jgi:hypothetical protein